MLFLLKFTIFIKKTSRIGDKIRGKCAYIKHYHDRRIDAYATDTTDAKNARRELDP